MEALQLIQNFADTGSLDVPGLVDFATSSWVVMAVIALFGLLYCFFGCKRGMRRFLGGIIGIALCAGATYLMGPHLIPSASSTLLIVLTVVAAVLGGLIFGFGNIILEFAFYYLVIQLILQFFTNLAPTPCAIIAVVASWVICIIFIKDRVVPTAVAGAGLCALASTYFGNLYVAGGVLVVMLILGLLVQRAFVKAAKKKEAEEEAAKAAETPDLSGLPRIQPPEDAAVPVPNLQQAAVEPTEELVVDEVQPVYEEFAPEDKQEPSTIEMAAVETKVMEPVELEEALEPYEEAEIIEGPAEFIEETDWDEGTDWDEEADQDDDIERDEDDFDDYYSLEDAVISAQPSAAPAAEVAEEGGKNQGVALVALAATAVALVAVKVIGSFKRG